MMWSSEELRSMNPAKTLAQHNNIGSLVVSVGRATPLPDMLPFFVVIFKTLMDVITYSSWLIR